MPLPAPSAHAAAAAISIFTPFSPRRYFDSAERCRHFAWLPPYPRFRRLRFITQICRSIISRLFADIHLSASEIAEAAPESAIVMLSPLQMIFSSASTFDAAIPPRHFRHIATPAFDGRRFDAAACRYAFAARRLFRCFRQPLMPLIQLTPAFAATPPEFR